MSGTTLEWLVIVVFLLLFVGVMAGEIVWLVMQKWTTVGRAAAFVITSNIVSLIIGSILIGIIMFIMFMMVMGPQGTGSDIPESAYIVGIAIAVALPPILLVIAKRVMLAVLNIRSGGSAWLYSAVSTMLAFLITLVPTFLFAYFITRR
jgi:hypothetical protein